MTNQYPTLFYKGKGGATYQWRVWAEGNTVLTEYGQVGGKQQRTPGKVCAPTNVGRSNERAADIQAQFEAESLWTNKIERKYSKTPEEAAEQLFLPMLAHPIEKAKSIPFPVDCQVKLDGVRCLAYLEDGVVTLMSRSGKPYRVPHVELALRELLDPGDVFDGELYRFGVSCQTITSWVKRTQIDTLKIQYHVYDMPAVAGVDNLPWVDRHAAYIQRLVQSGRRSDTLTTPIVTVTSQRQNSMSDVQVFQRYCVEQGYEGAMVRLLDGKYEWGYRSKHLLKVKTFDDSEHEVVGAREGEGKMAGSVVFRCKTTEGGEFDVSMACTMEERQRYWRERTQYIGRKLTLKHFGKTDDGLPRFPVGKCFRSSEDLPKETE